ncbi:unnamed protein product, partial [Gulo gulo]
SRGVLPLLGSPRARCSLGEHGRFRCPSRAGASLTAAAARRTPPSAAPAPQSRRSLQPFLLLPPPRHGEELELRESWLPAGRSTAAQRGLPVQCFHFSFREFSAYKISFCSIIGFHFDFC